MEENRIVIYQTDDGQTKIDVRLENDTVWLTQAQMSDLFLTDRTSIVRHINNIYKVGELERDATCAKIAQVQMEGNRLVKRNIPFYNLDMIISVGYRVNSKRGVKTTKNSKKENNMNRRIVLIMLLVFSAFSAIAQTENPRGIYKLAGINGKDGQYFKEPFDQYKLCGDNVTLTMVAQGNGVRFFKNDSQAFNYTGSEPASADDKSSLIYDSDANGFKLKWWSNYPNHRIFPANGWCIETYRSNGFSKMMKAISDGFQTKMVSDKKKDLTGRWRMLGLLDELRDVKKDTKRMKDGYAGSLYYNRNFVVFGDKYMVETLNRGQAYYEEIEYVDKKGYKIIKDRFDDSQNETRMITWISNDLIAVELKMDDYRTDYQILERMKDDKSVLEYIFEWYQ